MNANQAAEAMQTEICAARSQARMPRFDLVLGSDWASGKWFDLSNVEDYVTYAYLRAAIRYGDLPYRERYTIDE